jgi:DNA-3-methyladenine glycosylase II
MTDKEIHAHFTSFRGIGPWTSEMVCIFALLRPDVFSIGDIGLIKAVQILDPTAESKDDVLRVSKRWAPYRTAASWYLWRMLDPVPVEY